MERQTGNMMLATKLDVVLKSAKSSPVAAPAPVAAAAPAKESLSATPASSVTVDGFESSANFAQMKAGFIGASTAEKEALLKKGKGIFQFDIKVCLRSSIWTMENYIRCSIARS